MTCRQYAIIRYKETRSLIASGAFTAIICHCYSYNSGIRSCKCTRQYFSVIRGITVLKELSAIAITENIHIKVTTINTTTIFLIIIIIIKHLISIVFNQHPNVFGSFKCRRRDFTLAICISHGNQVTHLKVINRQVV